MKEARKRHHHRMCRRPGRCPDNRDPLAGQCAASVSTCPAVARRPIWNLYSIVYMEPIIYRGTIYLRYIPGISWYPGPHDKSYLSVGFNACIACLGCALWYTQFFKDWRSSMLKIQSSNHFYGICLELEYIILRPVYNFQLYNSGLVLVNSQNNLEADS